MKQKKAKPKKRAKLFVPADDLMEIPLSCPFCGESDVGICINHLRGICTCCGGTKDPDPPGVSTRAAAKMAKDYIDRGGRLRS